MNLLNRNVRKLFINADDFAQSEAIDSAIIDLAERNIISSTSALVLSPRWEKAASRLVNFPIQVGLHLDLTSHFCREFNCEHRLSKLIFSAYTQQLNTPFLKEIIELQWDRFTNVYGRMPDFIDGHQHIHQLPMVREALFSIIRKKHWGTLPEHWLRSCQTPHWRGTKAALISALGANKTKSLASQLSISTNSDFAGVYDFSENSHLKNLWQNWLAQMQGERPVIMCHVARPSEHLEQYDEDPIYKARLNEYHWLTSKEFDKLLQSTGFTVFQHIR